MNLLTRDDRYLRSLEAKSIYIIREAYYRHRDKLAMLWSMGKDSTTLLHLVRKAFLGSIPFPVIHIDTTYKFKSIYAFRDKYAAKWKLDLLVVKNEEAIKNEISSKSGRFDCCHALKTEALRKAIESNGFKALLVGIRRDEHAIRAKERYFSSRDKEFKWDYKDQPLVLWLEYFSVQEDPDAHVRIHPLLHWREIDVWKYIKMEKLPVVDLYFAKNNKRYRSIGCESCCEPVQSKANTIDKIIKEITNAKVSERSGRAQDKEREYAMQKLRALGYM